MCVSVLFACSFRALFVCVCVFSVSLVVFHVSYIAVPCCVCVLFCCVLFLVFVLCVLCV